MLVSNLVLFLLPLVSFAVPLADDIATGRAITDASTQYDFTAAVYDESKGFTGLCTVYNVFWIICHSKTITANVQANSNSFVIQNPPLTLVTQTAVGTNKIKEIVPLDKCGTNNMVMCKICLPLVTSSNILPLPTAPWVVNSGILVVGYNVATLQIAANTALSLKDDADYTFTDKPSRFVGQWNDDEGQYLTNANPDMQGFPTFVYVGTTGFIGGFLEIPRNGQSPFIPEIFTDVQPCLADIETIGFPY